jgi:hypothetical protein
MWFNKSKKPIEITFYTNRKDVFEYAKPKAAAKFLPEWWKTLPKLDFEKMSARDDLTPNMRSCYGFINHYKHGFIIPMWSDLIIDIGAEPEQFFARYSDNLSSISPHSNWQANNFFDTKTFQHLKLETPWYAFCDEEVDFTFADPMWHRREVNKYTAIPGTLDLKYQHMMNVNLFLSRKEGQNTTVHIPHGTPIAHILPLSDRPLLLKYELVSNEAFDKLFQNQSTITFFKKYQGIRRFLKNDNKN